MNLRDMYKFMLSKWNSNKIAMTAAIVTIVVGIVSLPTYIISLIPESNPKVILKNEGIQWSERSFIDAFIAKDARVMNLFFDGGWKVDEIRFINLIDEYYYPGIAKHMKTENVLDPAEYCYAPMVSLGKGAFISDDNQYWRWQPTRYEKIFKSGIPEKTELVRAICGNKDTISKIDKIKNFIDEKKNLSAGEMEIVSRWREVRKVLTGEAAPW